MKYTQNSLLVLAASLVLLLWQPRISAVEEAQLVPIRELGALNGIALHCKRLGETQRMKRALVANLPKLRLLGELFDYATNRSYMQFIEENADCPGPESFSQQIDEALQRLQEAYGRQ